nr:hypothetical protein [Spirosomataceae bacterium]
QYVFLNFLIFSGAALNWSEIWPKNLTPSDSWSIVVGLLVVLVFVKLVVEVLKKWPLKSSKMTYFLAGSLIFLLGTGFVLSASRLQKDEIWMHINRYRVHSVAALVLTYLYFVPMLATRFTAFLTTLGVVFLFFCLSYFHFYSVFDFNKRGFLAGQFNWTTTGEWFVYRDTPYWEGASKIVMQNARQSHLYQLDHTPFSVIQPSATTTKLNVKHQAAEKILSISGESPQIRFRQNPVDYYFVFKNLSTHKTYLHAAQYDARSVRLVALGNPYYYPTFHTYLHYRHFPAGQYQVGYATVSPDSRLQCYWQDFYFSTEPVLALRK